MVEYMEGASRKRAENEFGRAGSGGSARSRTRAEADRARTCERVSVDPRFVELRRRFALQSGLLFATFFGGYMTYLLLSAYARDFMSIQVLDSINVALLLGIGQFLFSFLLAWAFCRFSTSSIDPLAEELREHARAENAVDTEVAG